MISIGFTGDFYPWRLVENEFAEHFKTKDFLIQEFQPEIKTVGETSFIFFNLLSPFTL